MIDTRILYKYGNFEEYRVPYARRYHQVSWSGFPLIRTFSVSGKIRYLDTSLKRCVSKSMYVRILCDLTRIRIRTLLAHCFIYGGGHWCCLELFQESSRCSLFHDTWKSKGINGSWMAQAKDALTLDLLSYKDNYIPRYVKNPVSSFQWLFSVTLNNSVSFLTLNIQASSSFLHTL